MIVISSVETAPPPGMQRFVRSQWHPAESGTPEPAAIMERCPAPRLVADPGPAIPILPDPAAIAIRRPIGAYGRTPDGAIVRRVHPAAVGIQVLGSINIGAYVLIARG